jgi:hypothetical protein
VVRVALAVIAVALLLVFAQFGVSVYKSTWESPNPVGAGVSRTVCGSVLVAQEMGTLAVGASGSAKYFEGARQLSATRTSALVFSRDLNHPQCHHGAIVAISPPTSASVVSEAHASDGRAAAVVIQFSSESFTLTARFGRGATSRLSFIITRQGTFTDG